MVFHVTQATKFLLHPFENASSVIVIIIRNGPNDPS